MTRQREVPSLQYRHPNQVNLTLPIREGISRIRVKGAARLNDAYGASGGVGGAGTLTMFEVQSGTSFISPGLRARKIVPTEESNRRLTRMIIDPDDYATPQAPGAYLPTDDCLSFLRVQLYNDATATWLPEGPILVVPSFDFFTTKGPTFTVSGIAPNLGVGAFPPNLPDTLGPGALNFKLPAFNNSISILNLDTAGGETLLVSFHPGMSPMVVPAATTVSLSGVGVPELFLASPNGNPWFTLQISAVNSG